MAALCFRTLTAVGNGAPKFYRVATCLSLLFSGCPRHPTCREDASHPKRPHTHTDTDTQAHRYRYMRTATGTPTMSTLAKSRPSTHTTTKESLTSTQRKRKRERCATRHGENNVYKSFPWVVAHVLAGAGGDCSCYGERQVLSLCADEHARVQPSSHHERTGAAMDVRKETKNRGGARAWVADTQTAPRGRGRGGGTPEERKGKKRKD